MSKLKWKNVAQWEGATNYANATAIISPYDGLTRENVRSAVQIIRLPEGPERVVRLTIEVLVDEAGEPVEASDGYSYKSDKRNE